MGIIHVNSSIKIDRPKVFILQYTDYKRTNLHTGGNVFILGYFTSKDNADNYVKQLIDERHLIAIKIGENKFGSDIIRYATVDEYGNVDITNAINLVIEVHEMDLDVNEISYYGVKYPDVEFEAEIKES